MNEHKRREAYIAFVCAYTKGICANSYGMRPTASAVSEEADKFALLMLGKLQDNENQNYARASQPQCQW